MNLPLEVINKITSYNATKYTNHVEIEFDYKDYEMKKLVISRVGLP